MKSIFYAILMICMVKPSSLLGQNHFVLDLKGTIYIDSSETQLTVNDIVEIRQNSKIKFGSIHDILISIMDDGKYVVFKPKKTLGKTNNHSSLTYIARNILLPLRKKTSSRDIFPSLTTYLNENRIMAIDGEITIPSLENKDSLFVKYNDNYKVMKIDSVKKIYNIKLDSVKNFYMDLYIKKNDDFKKLTKIYLYPTTNEKLISEINTISEGLRKQNLSEFDISEFIFGYIQDNYGYIPDEKLKSIIHN